MDDDDLEQRLVAHGESWRAAHPSRPRVDWPTQTAGAQRRGGWFATFAVAAAVVVAAVVVPLVALSGSDNHPAANQGGPANPGPINPRAGAPSQFVALRHGMVNFVSSTRSNAYEPHDQPVTAIGVVNGHEAYAATVASGCRTTIREILDTTTPGLSALTNHDVATVAGGQNPAGSAPAMAVSPDGTKLALAVTTPGTGAGPDPCEGPEQLVVLNLRTHAVRHWTGHPGNSVIRFLQWGPDSRSLAYQSGPCCGGRSDGTRILDTSAPGTSYVHSRIVLTAARFLPVFWWHGTLVAAQQDRLHTLADLGQLGGVVGSGFPTDRVTSLSSDPSGDHLILIAAGITYRWDNGVLAVIAGSWTQAGW
jgi:hypothetical protein